MEKHTGVPCMKDYLQSITNWFEKDFSGQNSFEKQTVGVAFDNGTALTHFYVLTASF